MIDAPDATATRPYLIRALYEWCTDNGFTPYVAVVVDETVLVPREYVKDGEIVLNISFDATSSLKLGNDFIEFKARFGGKAREIMVPVNRVIAIYARENGQGMAFPLNSPKPVKSGGKSMASQGVSLDEVEASVPEIKAVPLASVVTDPDNSGPSGEPEPPRPSMPGGRPALKRVK